MNPSIVLYFFVFLKIKVINSRELLKTKNNQTTNKSKRNNQRNEQTSRITQYHPLVNFSNSQIFSSNERGGSAVKDG